MYHFFKKIALREKKSFSKLTIFLGTFLNNTLFMFVVLTDFNQLLVEKSYFIFSSILGSVFFGLFMSAIYTTCLNEQLKEYLKITNKGS